MNRVDQRETLSYNTKRGIRAPLSLSTSANLINQSYNFDDPRHHQHDASKSSSPFLYIVTFPLLFMTYLLPPPSINHHF